MLGLVGASLCLPALPAAVEPALQDLTAVSLEELSQIKVTSVARKQQSLMRVAAAVYVITAEDIRRSGATRIPEVLRLAPGLEVAQIDANQWAVSARGFNGRFANKLLVMIDGRTIYNTFFSGVYWDLQDVPMEEIERIEVVRGPGATIWGANAVNGVINIITKKASDSQGGMVQTGYGTQSGPQTTVRYGGAAPGGHYRAYGRFQNRFASPPLPNGVESDDPMAYARGGLRYDIALSSRDQLLIDADAHHDSGRQSLILVSPQPPLQSFRSTPMFGTAGHVLGRWKRELSERSDFTLQGYYDYIDRDEKVLHHYSARTSNVDFQHRFQHAAGAEMNWGLEYRSVSARFEQGRLVRSPKTEDRLHFLSGFIQEEIELLPDELLVTFGTKLEQSTLGGFQPQPSARASWTPTPDTAIWGAVSKAVRTPSWGEANTEFDGAGLEGPFGLNVVAGVIASPELQNENVRSYEAGVRFQPASIVSIDLASFFNRYSGLRSIGEGDLELRLDPVRYLYLPAHLDNSNCADSYGLELSTKWRLRDGWRITANHSYLKIKFKLGGSDLIEEFEDRQSPTHRISLLSSWDLSRNMQLDVGGYYVGRALAGGFVRRKEEIPPHVRANVRWQWRPVPSTRIELGAQDLFDPQVIQFEPEAFFRGAPAGRNIYGRITWSF